MSENNQTNPKVEKLTFRWLNKARSKPKSLVKHLEKMLTKFDGNILTLPDGTRLRTQEGAAVISFQNRTKKNKKKFLN